MKVNYLESLVRVEMFLQGVMIEISFVANGTVIRKGAHVSTNVLLISRFRSKTFGKKGKIPWYWLLHIHTVTVIDGRWIPTNLIDR